MKAIKIKMKPGCGFSNNLLEIDEIYLEGYSKNGYYTKENLHDFLKNYPDTIQVNIPPYPSLQPLVSQKGEKYVRSEPNCTQLDNLLCLPRE